MIDVWRDREGARIALEELFEEEFLRAILRREADGANEETRERMEARVPSRTLAWGYYRFAQYLLSLDELRKAGIGIDERNLAAFELDGLLALDRARSAFNRAHPDCGVCGTRQPNRFGRECVGCGTKFQRRK